MDFSRFDAAQTRTSVKVKDNTCKSNLGVTGCMILGKEMKKSKKR